MPQDVPHQRDFCPSWRRLVNDILVKCFSSWASDERSPLFVLLIVVVGLKVLQISVVYVDFGAQSPILFSQSAAFI